MQMIETGDSNAIVGAIHPTRKGRPGRKPVKMDNRGAELIKALGECLPMTKALALVGLTDEQMRAWRSRFPDFSRQVERTMAGAELRLLERVEAGAAGWQGSAWILERSRGYYQTARQEVSGLGGGAVQIATVNAQLLGSLAAEREARIKKLPT